MTYDQIKSWAQNNFEIGSHSFDHKNLNTLNDKEIIKQLNESKLFIKKIFSRNVESFSYPYGKYNKEISLLVKKYYKFAVTTKRSRFDKSKFSLLEIPRIPINPDTGVLKFYLKVKTYYEDLKFRKQMLFSYRKSKCINGCELFNDEKNYSYWEGKKETQDEIEILSFLNIHDRSQMIRNI